MSRLRSSYFILPLALITTVACGDNSSPNGGAGDSSNVAVIEAPSAPRIVAIDVGRALGDSGRILGSGVEHFPETDTLYVGIGASYVVAGTPISVRLLSGAKVLETVNVTATAPGEDGNAHMVAVLPSAATVNAGKYSVEVLLDGVSQGIREFTFDK